MIKVTKFGIICNMVSDISYHLGIAEMHSNTHLEAMTTPHYYSACSLRDSLRSLGIQCEFISDYVGDRLYFIGVSIKDGTKGAPAFPPCSNYVFVRSNLESFLHFSEWSKENGFDPTPITAELKKIYGCK